ncbi:MAG: M20 family metallopeptidase [Syntrophobacteraceae bacterium]
MERLYHSDGKLKRRQCRQSIYTLCLAFLLAFSNLFLFMPTAVRAAPAAEGQVIAAIDEKAGTGRMVSQKIFELREAGREEFKSSQLLKEELGKLGFKVTENLPVPPDLVEGGISKTAFRAELAGKGPGPTITIMLEYDALRNGHSCGHNLIASSGFLAAAGLSRIMAETPGRLLVIGTPDEERGSLGGGKIALLEGGHFAGTDVVLITHPSDRWSLTQRILAMKRATFAFKGKASHAAAAPHKGISALDAVLLTFNATDMLREHVREDVRIHGIIKKGGDQVNVVPELAEAEFAVRALDTSTMEEVYAKVLNCAKAGALATGANLDFREPRTFLKAPVRVPAFVKMVTENLKSLGVRDSDIEADAAFGSSDLGNVGHAYPTMNLMFKAAPDGTALHSDEFREAAASDSAWTATVIAAKAVALTAHQLLTQPNKMEEIKSKFKELKEKEGR